MDVGLDEKRAKQCWCGYLYWGRWTDSMLGQADILLWRYVSVNWFASERMQRAFCAHLAGIAVYASIHPLDNGWLFRFLVTVSKESREMWADEMRSVYWRARCFCQTQSLAKMAKSILARDCKGAHYHSTQKKLLRCLNGRFCWNLCSRMQSVWFFRVFILILGIQWSTTLFHVPSFSPSIQMRLCRFGGFPSRR